MRPTGAGPRVTPRSSDPDVTQRQRKFAGAIALLALVSVYAMLALAVAVVLQVQNANKIVELAYYAIAGLLWVLPAGVLIKWMQKPDA
jgi:Protein of unknown function (DUF2842)